MRVFSGPRSSGKTTYLLKYAESLEGYTLIVCHSQQEVFRLWRIICESGLHLPMPISADEFIREQFRGRHDMNIVIDNADYLLKTMCHGARLAAITLTEETDG